MKKTIYIMIIETVYQILLILYDCSEEGLLERSCINLDMIYEKARNWMLNVKSMIIVLR